MEKKRTFHLSAFSVIVFFVLLTIMGITVIPLLNVKLNPSRSLPRMTVSYNWSNASARVVEQEVTSKLEPLFSRIKGIKDVTSESEKGAGNINLSFKSSVNIDAVRLEVSTLIRQVYKDLPDDVSYPSMSLGSSGKNNDPIMTYILVGSGSPFFIQKYAEEHVIGDLQTLPGVKEVRVSGATPYEWEIEFNSQKLNELGLSSNELTTKIEQYFQQYYLGEVSDVSANHYGNISRIYMNIAHPDSVNLSSIPVANVDNRLIYLGDLSKIQYKEELPTSYYRINGLNTINLVIYPEDNVNTLKLGTQIKTRLKEIIQNLPAGYSLILSSDSTENIKKELDKIFYRTILSMLILLFFIFLITREWNYLGLMTVSIIVNLSVACIFYYLLGIEIHLYSLAGITISFGMIIDNSIIMIDHIRHQGNRKAFLAILAATLTTIGALSMVFFLKKEQQVNLVEFAQVIIVNLLVSLSVALFFIPSLMEKIKLKKKAGRTSSFKKRRRVLRLNDLYARLLLVAKRKRFKWIFVLLLILGFGIPVHLLPDKLDKKDKWSTIYNETLGSDWFKNNLKPKLSKIVGGSLRLFTEDVFEQSYYWNPGRTKLYVNGSMPEGCTIQQLNKVFEKMENFLSKYNQIDQFTTAISSYDDGNITITFKPEFENSAFPFQLKEEITSKAISLGGLDWDVYGVGQAFSNGLGGDYTNSSINLEGYNYEQLYAYAEQLKTKISQNPRVKDIKISGSNNYWSSRTLVEFFMRFNKQRFTLYGISPSQFYAYLKDKLYHNSLSNVYNNGKLMDVSLVSDSYGKYTVWDLQHLPISIDGNDLKFEDLAHIQKEKSGNNIYKKNQQYTLVLNYNYIGPSQVSDLVKDRYIKEFKKLLPLGYFVESSNDRFTWNRKSKNQYFLIGIVILIIYFICSILLESFTEPLAIVLMIPVSFIGVFLTFYLFGFNFDQGGFASFVLLCGIVVNAGLYIINDFNNFRKDRNAPPNLRTYMKAFNHKIIPVFLTVISTVLGLIPFLWGGQHDAFWFAFAAGASGGLLFSIIAVLFYLPLFMKLKDK